MKPNKIDGCLMGNLCGDGTCISTSTTTFTCGCPMGSINSLSCIGAISLLLISFQQ